MKRTLLLAVCFVAAFMLLFAAVPNMQTKNLGAQRQAAETTPAEKLAAVVKIPGEQTATLIVPLYTAITQLTVAEEVRTGYLRDLFPHWIDADSDGCNSRQEVLLAEAIVAPNIGPNCQLTGGQWYSYYDAAYWTNTSDIDIDHMVPLAEAWDSGARDWDTTRRRAYANDLDDPRPLVGVTDNVNQSKGDKDPAEWMPTLERCRYIEEWVATKMRWHLTVDEVEKAVLARLAEECPDAPITVTEAF